LDPRHGVPPLQSKCVRNDASATDRWSLAKRPRSGRWELPDKDLSYIMIASCGQTLNNPGRCTALRQGWTTAPKDGRTDGLKQLILDRGAVAVGIADLCGFFEEPSRKQVFAVAFGMRYPDSEIDLLPSDEALQTAMRGITEQTKDIYSEIDALIQGTDPGAICRRIDTVEPTLGRMHPQLSQKAVAVLAGLGWIGKSSLLVHPVHGPRMRIGTMFTDTLLAADEPYKGNHCGRCEICVDACPAQAVSGEEVRFGSLLGYCIDRETCRTHLYRHESRIHRAEFCGLCLKECPIGKVTT